MKKINHWINGKNVAGSDYFHTTNPATGEVLAEVASGGEAEIHQAVAAAKEAFPTWANLPMKERARLMRRSEILSINTFRRLRPSRPPTPACRSTRPKTCLFHARRTTSRSSPKCASR